MIEHPFVHENRIFVDKDRSSYRGCVIRSGNPRSLREPTRQNGIAPPADAPYSANFRLSTKSFILWRNLTLSTRLSGSTEIPVDLHFLHHTVTKQAEQALGLSLRSLF